MPVSNCVSVCFYLPPHQVPQPPWKPSAREPTPAIDSHTSSGGGSRTRWIFPSFAAVRMLTAIQRSVSGGSSQKLADRTRPRRWGRDAALLPVPRAPPGALHLQPTGLNSCPWPRLSAQARLYPWKSQACEHTAHLSHGTSAAAGPWVRPLLLLLQRLAPGHGGRGATEEKRQLTLNW